MFTAVSSDVFDLFDHCKLYTLMTINFVLYAEALLLHYIAFWLNLHLLDRIGAEEKEFNHLQTDRVHSRTREVNL